jgi:hypothetical protein
MAESRRIAQLAGPVLIALTMSEAVNLRIWKVNLAPVTYLNGCLLLVAGLAMVRAHNVWVRRWEVLVTIVGWGAMAGGLWRMFAPEARQGGENGVTYAVLGVLFAVGVVLTAGGYGRR